MLSGTSQYVDEVASVRSGKTPSEWSSSTPSSKSRCHICSKSSPLDVTSLVQCAKCHRRYHKGCHKPVVSHFYPSWKCFRCNVKQAKLSSSATKTTTYSDRLMSSHPGSIESTAPPKKKLKLGPEFHPGGHTSIVQEPIPGCRGPLNGTPCHDRAGAHEIPETPSEPLHPIGTMACTQTTCTRSAADPDMAIAAPSASLVRNSTSADVSYGLADPFPRGLGKSQIERNKMIAFKIRESMSIFDSSSLDDEYLGHHLADVRDEGAGVTRVKPGHKQRVVQAISSIQGSSMYQEGEGPSDTSRASSPDVAESLKDLLELPEAVVPMIYENQLAFRDATQVSQLVTFGLMVANMLYRNRTAVGSAGRD